MNNTMNMLTEQTEPILHRKVKLFHWIIQIGFDSISLKLKEHEIKLIFFPSIQISFRRYSHLVCWEIWFMQTMHNLNGFVHVVQFLRTLNSNGSFHLQVFYKISVLKTVPNSQEITFTGVSLYFLINLYASNQQLLRTSFLQYTS